MKTPWSNSIIGKIAIFLIGMIIGQLLFGGWGDGVIDYFFNKPSIIVEQTIIFSEESPEPIKMQAGPNPFGFGFITGIEVMGTNSTHCLLSSLVISEKIEKKIELRMDVKSELSDSSYPSLCDSNKDCVQFVYSLESINNKDIEKLYVEMCLDENYSFLLSGTNQSLKCITLEEDFVPMQKKVHSGIYIKIHNMGPNEEISDYAVNNLENIYPTIFVRDKKHKTLNYKQIKMLIQDILNCKVFELE